MCDLIIRMAVKIPAVISHHVGKQENPFYINTVILQETSIDSNSPKLTSLRFSTLGSSTLKFTQVTNAWIVNRFLVQCNVHVLWEKWTNTFLLQNSVLLQEKRHFMRTFNQIKNALNHWLILIRKKESLVKENPWPATQSLPFWTINLPLKILPKILVEGPIIILMVRVFANSLSLWHKRHTYCYRCTWGHFQVWAFFHVFSTWAGDLKRDTEQGRWAASYPQRVCQAYK